MQSCPSCGSTSYKGYKKIGNHNVFICEECKLLFSPTNESTRLIFIKKQYATSYTKGYSAQLDKFNQRYKNFLNIINLYKTKGNFLDVGCGSGYFLKYIKDHSLFKPFGVEPNTLLRKSARINTQLKIINGSLGNIPYKDDFFDVVTCLDVLEHDINLKDNISEIKRVLKPDGLLLLQAPNYKSYMAYLTGAKWDWWSIPDHVLHFSFEFITHYMRRRNFIVLKKYTYQDRSDYISNVKGLFRGSIPAKLLFFTIYPFILLLELISYWTNRGGLSLLIMKNKKK